jgi:hypothetical protein
METAEVFGSQQSELFLKALADPDPDKANISMCLHASTQGEVPTN